VDALHNDLQSPYKENATYKGGRLAIRPSRFTEYHSHLVPFEAFSYEDEYAKPSDDQEPAWPVMVEQLVHSEHTDMYRGRRHLKLGQTLWWKMHIGRPTDVEAVQQTLKIIHDQRLAGNSEFREILATIQEEDPFDVLRID
jgi:hypothetical protein